MTADTLLAHIVKTNAPQTIEQLAEALSSTRSAILPVLFALCDAGRVRLVRPNSEFAYVPFEWEGDK
jgi:predicted transcriptional regulator